MGFITGTLLPLVTIALLAHPRGGSGQAESKATRLHPPLVLSAYANGKTFALGAPVTLSVTMKGTEDGGRGPRVVYITLLDLFDVVVFCGPNQSAVQMTEGGKAAKDPGLMFSARGVYFGPNTTMTHQIPLSEWWDLSQPGSYTVLVRRVQRVGNGGTVTIRAKPVTFQVLKARESR